MNPNRYCQKSNSKRVAEEYKKKTDINDVMGIKRAIIQYKFSTFVICIFYQ